MEKVWGPIRGFYIAAYSVPWAGGGYVSYAKVCAQQPQSYWESQPLFKLFAGDDHGSEIEALGVARLIAEEHIERIPLRDRWLCGAAPTPTVMRIARNRASAAVQL